MLTITNLRLYGERPELGREFEVNIAPFVTGLSCFVNCDGQIICDDHINFTPTACRAIYEALIDIAPDGMKLLPEQQAVQYLKGGN